MHGAHDHTAARAITSHDAMVTPYMTPHEHRPTITPHDVTVTSYMTPHESAAQHHLPQSVLLCSICVPVLHEVCIGLRFDALWCRLLFRDNQPWADWERDDYDDVRRLDPDLHKVCAVAALVPLVSSTHARRPVVQWAVLFATMWLHAEEPNARVQAV